MRRRRRQRTAMAYGLLVVVIATSFGVLARSVLDAEDAALQQRRVAALDERSRLALWRMDAAVVPWLALLATQGRLEVSEPPAAGRAGAVFSNATAPEGGFVLPIARREVVRLLAESPTSETATAAAEAREQSYASEDSLRDAVYRNTRESYALHQTPVENPHNRIDNGIESQQRNWQSSNMIQVLSLNNDLGPLHHGPLKAFHWPEEAPPEWLLLARTRAEGGGNTAEVAWVPQQALFEGLLVLVRDLLPGASLRPVAPEGSPEGGHRLATLPYELVPGPSPDPAGALRWPAALLLAAGAMALALLGGGVALWRELAFAARGARMAAALTHELRTPLTTLTLHLDLLREGMVADPAAQSRTLATLSTAARRLEGVVESVLLEARLEEHRGGMRREERPLPAVFEEARQALADTLATEGWELHLKADLPAVATHLDARALGRILTILGENALRHAPAAQAEGFRLTARVEGEWLHLRASDGGPGLQPSVARRAFTPWSRGGEESAEGLGLGLSIAHGIARALGGELRHAGEVGGATFDLRLPLAVGGRRRVLRR